MGTYNTVRTEISCPRCGSRVVAEVDCRLGYTNEMVTLVIGDAYPFRPGETPPTPSFEADGYAECPACNFDFGCAVRIEAGSVVAVRPEPRTLVHRHDAILMAAIQCPSCVEHSDAEIKLYQGGSLLAEPLHIASRYPPLVGRPEADGRVRGRAYCKVEGCSAIYPVEVRFHDAHLVGVVIDPHREDVAEGLW